jgi:hypothetical protein
MVIVMEDVVIHSNFARWKKMGHKRKKKSIKIKVCVAMWKMQFQSICL